MPRNSKPPKKEEEYHFTEGEEEIIPPEKPKRNGIKTVLRNKRLWLIIGIILAVFVVYQFIGKKSPVKQEIAELETQPQQPPISTITTPVPVPTTTTPVSVPVVETVATGVSDQLNTLTKQIQQNQSQIQQLQTGMQQLQNTVSQLTGQVSSLVTTVTSLTPSVSKIVNPPASSVVVKKIVTPPLPFYSVRAVVPGRAWIQQKKYQHVVRLFTVKVGDFIPGYGTVLAIHSRTGRVSMSWGSVIRYENGNPLASP